MVSNLAFLRPNSRNLAYLDVVSTRVGLPITGQFGHFLSLDDPHVLLTVEPPNFFCSTNKGMIKLCLQSVFIFLLFCLTFYQSILFGWPFFFEKRQNHDFWSVTGHFFIQTKGRIELKIQPVEKRT